MLSSKVKEQGDYKIMINMINNSLNRDGPNGSILVGKYYATKYRDIFSDMLSGEEVNMEILHKTLESVDDDVKDIREDCRRRIRSSFTDSNDYMISMITDFVKSL